MAVQAVLDSRRAPGAPAGAAMAVLVQPYLDAAVGGVLFGVDPVSGRSDRRVVSAVAAAREPLVSGTVAGSRYVVDAAGAVVERDRGDGPRARRRTLRRLVALAARAAERVRRPAGRRVGDRPPATGCWLLQSPPGHHRGRAGVPIGPGVRAGPRGRDVPRAAHRARAGPVGAAAEARPSPHAVRLAGSASQREVAASEIVVTVRGHVGIDLRLAGELVERPSAAGSA